MTLFTLCPTGTIFSVACVGLSDVFMHSRVPHCTTFGAICGIMGVFVGCEVVGWNPIWRLWGAELPYHSVPFAGSLGAFDGCRS